LSKPLPFYSRQKEKKKRPFDKLREVGVTQNGKMV